MQSFPSSLHADGSQRGLPTELVGVAQLNSGEAPAATSVSTSQHPVLESALEEQEYVVSTRNVTLSTEHCDFLDMSPLEFSISKDSKVEQWEMLLCVDELLEIEGERLLDRVLRVDGFHFQDRGTE